MGEFLSFNKMLTPTLIKIIFFVGCGISVLAGLGIIISGMNAYDGGGFMVLLGLIVIVVGPFLTRVYCELLIVLFKMHENLRIVAKQFEGNSPTTPPTQTTRSASSEQANI